MLVIVLCAILTGSPAEQSSADTCAGGVSSSQGHGECWDTLLLQLLVQAGHGGSVSQGAPQQGQDGQAALSSKLEESWPGDRKRVVDAIDRITDRFSHAVSDSAFQTRGVIWYYKQAILGTINDAIDHMTETSSKIAANTRGTISAAHEAGEKRANFTAAIIASPWVTATRVVDGSMAYFMGQWQTMQAQLNGMKQTIEADMHRFAVQTTVRFELRRNAVEHFVEEALASASRFKDDMMEARTSLLKDTRRATFRGITRAMTYRYKLRDAQADFKKTVDGWQFYFRGLRQLLEIAWRLPESEAPQSKHVSFVEDAAESAFAQVEARVNRLFGNVQEALETYAGLAALLFPEVQRAAK